MIADAVTTLVCPLCPLHCDDVQVDANGVLRVPDCTIANGFVGGGKPRGRFAGLGNVKLPPRVITTGTCLQTARGLIAMQSAGRIQLSIESDPSIAAIGRVASRDGTVSCTLSEISAHADWVMTVGDVAGVWPRLIERLKIRDVIERDHWTADEIANMVIGEPTRDFDAQRFDSLQNSKFAVFIIAPGAFPESQSEIVASVLNRWVRVRNETSRAFLLTLDAAATLRSVSLWQTNRSPETVSAFEKLDVAPEQMILRIGTPPSSAVKAHVQMGGIDGGPTTSDAYVPLATPGWDVASAIVRGDGSVSLPLLSVNDSDPEHPTILQWLTQSLESATERS